MKYVVTRTNCGYDENPECPGAQKEMIPSTWGLKEAYTIEISSLEELHQLSKKVECPIIVFIESNLGCDLPELEIYDGYRE